MGRWHRNVLSRKMLQSLIFIVRMFYVTHFMWNVTAIFIIYISIYFPILYHDMAAFLVTACSGLPPPPPTTASSTNKQGVKYLESDARLIKLRWIFCSGSSLAKILINPSNREKFMVIAASSQYCTPKRCVNDLIWDWVTPAWWLWGRSRVLPRRSEHLTKTIKFKLPKLELLGTVECPS